MARNYFTPGNAWKRFFFIHGLTADEFYTDGGMKMNIEQFLHMELKRSGYQRVVFYDQSNKLYCYDPESFGLLHINGNTAATNNSSLRRKNGLRRGRHAQLSGTAKEKETPVQSKAEEDTGSGEWSTGEKSGILIRRLGSAPFHLGLHDNVFVERQIDAYMNDAKIKTAIVINDPDSFTREFGNAPRHSLTAMYERLGTDNENIMVFIYKDDNLINLYKTDQLNIDESQNGNVIDILCPNAAELRNLLMYNRINHGLKLHMRDLDACAVSLLRAMRNSKENNRIKDVIMRLKEYPENEYLTPEKCYTILGEKKPLTAAERIDQLIGMENVKKEISKFSVGDVPLSERINGITSSRLCPVKPPKKENEMIHFVLTGNPGTGKTTVAELLGQLFYEMGYLESGHVVPADRDQLVAEYVGHTAIKTRRKVEEALGGVLFIDEAYSLKRDKHNNADFGQEAIDTLVKLMDQYKGKFIVVAAGYDREMKVFLDSNPGLASRFRKIRLEDYSPEEMQRILEFHAKRRNAVFSDDLKSRLPDFCENWVNLAGEDWGNAREAVNLINDMLRNFETDKEAQKVRSEDGKELSLLEIRHLPDEKKQNLKPVAQMRAEVLDRLNSMTGLSGVKATIERLRKRMIAGHMNEPGHYIFVGNPGTGKTTIARDMGMILRNLGMLKRGHMVEYTAADLISEVYNEDNRGDFSKVADKALDGVLFIDEAHQLAAGEGRRIRNALVPYMEKNRKNLCVIIAGYEDEMTEFLRTDPGLRGRFTETIVFENYNRDEMHGILLNQLKERGLQPDDDYKENALRALDGYMNMHKKDKDFANGRYIRNDFIPGCLDQQSSRLIKQYGENIPEEEKKKLTGTDIPADLARFTKTPVKKPDTRSAMEKMESMIGHEKLKKELHALIDNAEFNRTNTLGIVNMPERLHWALLGNPGTGKTTVVNLIGQVYKECGILPNGKVHKVTRSDLVAEHIGGTAIKTRNWINKAMGGILFIDEAYELSKGKDNSADFGSEAITELVEAMESLNGEFAVICAGYPDVMDDFLKSNDGLASRMKRFVFDDYTPQQLKEIFLLKCREEDVTVDDALNAKLEMFFANMKSRLSKGKKWGNGREVENVLRETLTNWPKNQTIATDENGHQSRLITVDHIPAKFKKFLIGEPEKQETPKTVMDEINDLIGFDEVKEKLLELIDLKKAVDATGREDLLEDINLHWVLRGNPGTGKTTVAKLIGKVYKELGLLENGVCHKVTRTDLVANYVGQTAGKTQKWIDKAMGGVLFIDEAYTLKPEGAHGSDFGQEAIDTLLEQMSDRNGDFAVIVAGYPKEMERFVNSNPGLRSRFGENFLLRDYSADELLKIFELKCKKKKFYLKQDMKDVVRAIFANMINANLKEWANAREAENLEKAMRPMWARKPVAEEDPATGNKITYYTVDHIPKRYQKYMPRSEKKPELEGVPALSETSFEDRYAVSSDEMPAVADKYTYDDDYLEQVNSVVFIKANSPLGDGSGSGSVIAKGGYILTCNHVIKEANEIQVRFKRNENGQDNVIWKKAEIIWTDEQIDAAILKTEGDICKPLPIRPFTEKTPIGELIYLWGYPFGERLSDSLDDLQPSLFQGSISSIQKKNGIDRINVNMEAKRGCSGGPVFSKKDGSIIGILCGSQTVGGDGLVEEINYVLPVKYIWLRAVKRKDNDAKQ